MGLLKHMRRTRAHGYALNFVLKSSWKKLSARLANSSALKNFDKAYVPRDQSTWAGLESLDFMDNLRFSIFKRYSLHQVGNSTEIVDSKVLCQETFDDIKRS
jgi:hypothetical protein